MVQKISNEVINVRAQYSELLEIQYSISEKIIFEMLEKVRKSYHLTFQLGIIVHICWFYVNGLGFYGNLCRA